MRNEKLFSWANLQELLPSRNLHLLSSLIITLCTPPKLLAPIPILALVSWSQRRRKGVENHGHICHAKLPAISNRERSCSSRVR
jgi:hypothetical protein